MDLSVKRISDGETTEIELTDHLAKICLVVVLITVTVTKGITVSCSISVVLKEQINGRKAEL